jgi:hypothetical protein
MMGEQPNPSGFTPALRSLCRDRCAFYGEPPCWKLPDEVQPCEQITPCDDCLRGVPAEEG